MQDPTSEYLPPSTAKACLPLSGETAEEHFGLDSAADTLLGWLCRLKSGEHFAHPEGEELEKRGRARRQ